MMTTSESVRKRMNELGRGWIRCVWIAALLIILLTFDHSEASRSRTASSRNDLPTFCKKTTAGRDFTGDLTVTKSGKPCQSWAVQTPNRHSYTDNKLFPDGSAEAAGNRCRNPDPSYDGGPWCYTTDPAVPWEVCDVQSCPTDLCATMNCTFFSECEVVDGEAFCACPNVICPAVSDPVCGTDKVTYDNECEMKRESCARKSDIKVLSKGECPDLSTFCKKTTAGRDFTGDLTVTKSGKPCQSWAVQTPNRHSYTDNKLFPDGSAEAAGNRCRNPDPSYDGGPWCYTTDPAVPWEVCDVQSCPKLTG